MSDVSKQVANFSRSVVRLTAIRKYDDGTQHKAKSTFTGFMWRVEQNEFIVTCWHCITGLNANTLVPLGSFTPSHLEMSYVVRSDGENGMPALFRRSRILQLEWNGKSTWFQHQLGHKVDIAAIPLAPIEGEEIFSLDWAGLHNDLRPQAGQDCFTIGYPEGFSSEFEMPIWKRGSIATEPELQYDKKDIVLVDTLSNSGMSGAPVIVQNAIGTKKRLLGVYAGREGNEGVGLQLARVWKASLLEEIFSGVEEGKVPT